MHVHYNIVKLCLHYNYKSKWCTCTTFLPTSLYIGRLQNWKLRVLTRGKLKHTILKYHAFICHTYQCAFSKFGLHGQTLEPNIQRTSKFRDSSIYILATTCCPINSSLLWHGYHAGISACWACLKAKFLLCQVVKVKPSSEYMETHLLSNKV